MTFLSQSSRAALATCACATAMVLAGALMATPAQATHRTAKATTKCSPELVNPSFPAPVLATNVSAMKRGAIKGKATVSWNWSNSYFPSGYEVYFRILTSNGQCTKPMIYSTGTAQCLYQKNAKNSTNWSCNLKGFSSGSTEFQVALWYQSGSGAWGPVVYSLWSAPLDVK